MVISLIVWVNGRRLMAQKKLLEQKVQERTEELSTANEEIIAQRDILETKNKDITDSILYAQRIQQATIPSEKRIKEVFPMSFVLFEPKDIVSGDFYWFSEVNEYTLISVVDCTGHGVPGAFMSMMGNDLLNEIVNDRHVTTASKVLDMLSKKVNQALNPGGETEIRDGMDIAFCALKKASADGQWSLQYAGAYNPLWLISPHNQPAGVVKAENEAVKLYEIKHDKQPIGFTDKAIQPFTNHVVTLSKGDIFYIFSDGYADQFGGESDKKFGYKKLRELLLSIHSKPMEEQHNILKETFIKWKSFAEEQVDDVCLIGLRV